MLRDDVKNTIQRYSMIKSGDTVIAAVSGGADSVALLHVLYSLQGELSFSLAACHVNHNLRGAESDGDEMFVRRMCRMMDIPLYVANIKSGRKNNHYFVSDNGHNVVYSLQLL